MINIIRFRNEYHDEVVNLILDIQNNEAKIDLSIDEQPDLLDITSSYITVGGNFWIAVEDGHVIGTIALMKLDKDWCVLKKFFVRSDYRSKKVGLALYHHLLDFANNHGFRHIILDTPAVAAKSHQFYERAGFRQVSKGEIAVDYPYPDRDSLLYRLDLN